MHLRREHESPEVLLFMFNRNLENMTLYCTITGHLEIIQKKLQEIYCMTKLLGILQSNVREWFQNSRINIDKQNFTGDWKT